MLSCHARIGGPSPSGRGHGVHGGACRAALWVASMEMEASLLRGLLAGGARVRGHNMRPHHAASATARTMKMRRMCLGAATFKTNNVSQSART